MTDIDNDKIFEKNSRRTPFIVPEGYLNELQNSIIERATQKSPKTTLARKSIWSKYPFKVACAAAVAIIFLFSIVFVLTRTHDRQSVTLEDVGYCFMQLSEDDQDNYLELFNEDIILTQIN